jgi:hypothetical protein
VAGKGGIKFTFTQRLTKTGMIYIFEHELPRVTKQPSVPGHAQHWMHMHTLSGALKMDKTTGVIDPTCIKSIPPFDTAEDLFGNATDFARLGLSYTLSKVFTGTKSMAKLEQMAPDMLEALNGKLNDTPFLLCLHRFSKQLYDMPPLGYAQLVRWLQSTKHPIHPPSERILPALRFIDFLRRKLRKGAGHTIFDQQLTLALYGKLEPGDAIHLLAGIHWLCQNGELVSLDPGLLVMPKDWKTGRAICIALAGIYQRAHVAEMVPTKRTQPHIVPCTSPPLTDEQLTAVDHVVHNWLTLVTGSPGTGKTSVIEALMRMYSKLAVGTFIGTMVSSLRARFGGRPESAHTLHSIINAITRMACRDYAESIECLIIDEGSNIDQALMSQILSCFPNLSRLVIVMDPWQINPIGPGKCVALEYIVPTTLTRGWRHPRQRPARNVPPAHLSADAKHARGPRSHCTGASHELYIARQRYRH